MNLKLEEIILNAHSGYVSMKEMEISDGYAMAVGTVHVEWFTAAVTFESSLERLIEFLQELDQMINGDLDKVFFINESGNFELNMELDKTTGHVVLSGLVMKSLNEMGQLEFSLDTDWISIRRFHEDFKRISKL